jgi:hypothetical protein
MQTIRELLLYSMGLPDALGCLLRMLKLALPKEESTGRQLRSFGKGKPTWSKAACRAGAVLQSAIGPPESNLKCVRSDGLVY